MTPRLRVLSEILIAGTLSIWMTSGVLSLASSDSSEVTANQDWPQATGDLGNRRYSALSQVNAENVKNLGAAWVSDKLIGGGIGRVTPVVHNGVMFVAGGTKVYALDAKTGSKIWEFETAHSGPATGRGGPNGSPNRQGVGVGEGKVFVATTDAHMIALDEKTGKVIWYRLCGDDLTSVQHGGISVSPVYVNGVIYSAVVFDEARYIGRILALDAGDGHQIWRWDTIPGPGKPGHETWTNDPTNDTWKMGGASAWQPPVVDPDLGLVYYDTGNPSPNLVGSARPGNNLYSCSVVALDMKTGKLRWYYQVIHHDLWEGDLANPLVLYDSPVNGGTRKGLAVMRPDGTLFLLDRATGKPIWPVEERPVRQSVALRTSPTQPFPVGRESLIERGCSHWTAPPGFILHCEYFQPPMPEPPNVLRYSGYTRVSPMSYSPQTGYFYIQGVDRLDWEWNSSRPLSWEFASISFLTGRVPGLDNQVAMIFAAVDPKTYKVVWKKEFRAPPIDYGVGGWLTTAGGLAFHRLEDGNLVAYDAKTGDELWKFQTGVVANEVATPMSYEVDGQQYVSVIEDSQIWTFGLGGTIPPRPAPQLVPREILRGPIQDSQVIRASVPNDWDYRHDISPLKARVKAGSQVTFMNTGSEIHSFVAADGSWTTGSLLPRQAAILTFDKPGTYLYHCKEHPWSYGLLIVTEETSGNAAGKGSTATEAAQTSFAAQAGRGRDVYQQQCSGCHQADLGGNDMVPALAGSVFTGRWQGKTGKDLFERTRTTMPSGAPESLSPQAYLDLVAYLLQVNGVSRPTEISVESLTSIPVP